ncbi:MAG: hypothetical protein GC162_18370 [Planctomycetes bacterium]|nr:hypothetical protein [Planctomycetota bacterium]
MRNWLWVWIICGWIAGVASAQSGPTQQRVISDQKYAVHGVAFSPDGKYLAIGEGLLSETRAVGKLRVHRLEDQKVVAIFDGDGPFATMGFTADGENLAAAALRQVRVYNLPDHRMVTMFSDGDRDFPTMALDGAGGEVMSPSRGGFGPHGMYVWQLKDHKFVTRVDGEFMSIARAGSMIALGGRDGRVSIVDGKTWRIERTLGEERRGREVSVLAVSPDGKRIFAWARFGKAQIWNVADGTTSEIEGEVADLNAAAFSPDGRTLALAGDDLRIYDATNLKLRSTTKAHNHGVLCLAFSPDGKTLATGGNYDATVILWSVP